MDNLEFLVQEITNRLLDRLQESSPKQTLFIIGDKSKFTHSNEFVMLDCAEDAEKILALGLTVDSILRIANLCPFNSVEKEVIENLLAGRTVLIPSEDLNLEHYRHSSKALLYQELLDKKHKLEQFGVQFYSQGSLSNPIKQNKETLSSFDKTVEKKVSKKAKLLTESRLRSLDLADDSEFHVEKGTIITALARDYLNRRRITIIE
ncbi:TPA: hypothetical protein U2D20_000575 [Streptococcus suis]|nr:hypothetical protein [Streptococcus suis]